MSSIQDLVKKIEKNQQRVKQNTIFSEQKKKESEELSTEENKKKSPFKKYINLQKKEENILQKKIENKDEKKIGKKGTPVKRFFVTQVCTSKKACGEHYGPYIWERLCHDFDQDPECESFEIQGFRFEKSPCQGNCKQKSNIRIKEEKIGEESGKVTQFSYITPIKASKLIQNIKSGASPENIKRL